MMTLKELSKKVTKHYQDKHPFVVYALPSEEKVTALFQKDNFLYESEHIAEEGFAFAPFSEDSIVLFPKAKCDVYEVLLSNSDLSNSAIGPPASKWLDVAMSDEEYVSYTQLVANAIEVIANGKVSKIVTSRTTSVRLSKLDFEVILSRLFQLESNAFRYLWFHPEVGMWCGATPEVLLTVHDDEFHTMALAGTQPYDENFPPEWSSKEELEQKWVVDDISDKLQHAAQVVKVEKTTTHRAGSVVHLRTDFTGIFKKNQGLEKMARALHPTPAVCGTPRDKAYEFIKEQENYDREFYTGFLGPVNATRNVSKLYVNLRCASLSDTKATLYAGGGITFASMPEEEWKETQFKLQAMLQVLAPLL